MKADISNALFQTLQDPDARCNLLQSVVLHANDSIVITEAEPLDAPGPKIVFVNAAFCRMTGYRPEDVIGKTPRILQGPKTDRAALARLKDALRQWQPTMVELLNYRKDGSEFWVEISLVPVANADGWYTHWIAIQRETSDRKRLETELLKTLQKERQLSELRSHFITMTSHEFRTPLTAILTAAELLEHYGRHWTEDDRLEQLRLIQMTVHQMTQMLDDILLLDRADAADTNDLRPAPVWFDLEAFCQTLVSECQATSGRDHDWKIINHLTQQRVYLDQALLRQVLLNVLSNAIKYSPAHSQITLEMSDRPEGVQFCIRDEGMGLNPQDLPRLCDLFYRGSNVGTIPGSGLGLAIAKRCLSLCGGEISFENLPEGGSQVAIALPFHKAPLFCQ
ncbi:MAG: ATP-binding protein [Cyanobacteriota bacterium]